MKNVIAIDGPAASGKSSVAKHLASELGAIHINTGSMYRAVAWKAMKNRIDWKREPEKLEAMLKDTFMRFVRKQTEGEPELELDGSFPGDALRAPEVSRGASAVAVLAPVRKRLVELQREMAGGDMLVMEGRDIGTAVFPDAKYKFYLTASPEERARRRLTQDGKVPSPESIAAEAADIAARDKQDMERELSPLVQASDAILIDNTGLTEEETLDKFMEYIRK